VIFSVIDVAAAFHHIMIQPGQEPLTAFKTPKGMYEYLVMPFGITNGPSIFQRYIEGVLRHLDECCLVYIDDVIIFSMTNLEHVDNTEAVLRALHDEGLKISHAKSQLDKSSVTYLGHKVTHGYVEAIIDYQCIQEWPEPRSKEDLQKYLGTVNWFRSHIPDIGSSLTRLYSKVGNDSWEWTHENKQDFSWSKNLVCNDLQLHTMQPSLPVDMFMDASGFGLGAIAFQNGRPISILSRGLRPAERNYTTTERELLAIVWATKTWRYIIESTRMPITVYTDHKVITQNFNADYSNRRMNRWTEHLMRLPISYKYIEGKLNPADFPSRRPDHEPGWGGEKEVTRKIDEAMAIKAWYESQQAEEYPGSVNTRPIGDRQSEDNTSEDTSDDARSYGAKDDSYQIIAGQQQLIKARFVSKAYK
jgi:hypothetical protein